MTGEVTVEMMSDDLLVWRCLHGGPLTRQALEGLPSGSRAPWERLRARNIPLLRKLTAVYGSCAVLARDGDAIVGQLRFYPKAICPFTEYGPAMCMQQLHPHGPADGFAENDFPPLDQIEDRTLLVHCLMTASPEQKDNQYRRRGIGSRMVCALVEWAKAEGWEAIEATAYADLPSIYTVTGQAGRAFWSKLGFRVVRTVPEPAFQGDEFAGFVRTLLSEGADRGIPPDEAKARHTVRLDL